MHKFEFDGPGNGFCYEHQSFDCPYEDFIADREAQIPEDLICIGCNKRPSELSEYVVQAKIEGFDTPDEYVLDNEGTLNKGNGHFLCTDCYIKAGQPSSRQGWKAP